MRIQKTLYLYEKNLFIFIYCKIKYTYLNISIVNSENFACSHADPTIKISCKLNVICADRSHGGVVNGLNLEPEPLVLSNWWSQPIRNIHRWPVLSNASDSIFFMYA